MRQRCMVALVGALVVAVPPAGMGQQFEGVVKNRSISVSGDALSERGFELSEAIFDVPTERILALREDLVPSGEMTITEIEIHFKGNLIRTDASDEEGPAYATMDLERGIMRLFRPSEEIYIEWSKEDMERMQAMSDATAEQPEVRETGRTKTINGMRCTAYDVEMADGVTRVWVSKDDANLMNSFLALSERMGALNMDVEVDESSLVAAQGFPVMVQRVGYDMYEIEELISVERRSVSSDLFAPPAGYRKMTMADMMRRPN